jgi:hypothetical protein
MKSNHTIILSLLACTCLFVSSCFDAFFSEPSKVDAAMVDAHREEQIKKISIITPKDKYVEPPLVEKPQDTYFVIVGIADELSVASRLSDKVAKVSEVPVGYPAVDQAAAVAESNKGWVVIAAKYARQEYATRLHQKLKEFKFSKAMVVKRPYRHDRLRPVVNIASGTKVGRVFSGMPGVEIPVSDQMSPESGSKGSLPDGQFVRVLRQEEKDGNQWYYVEEGSLSGYLPAGRLLVEYNIFPAANGKQAVLGNSLGCARGDCLWDYWLVSKNFRKRKVLLPKANSLAHRFSPDGSILAYQAVDRQLTLVFSDQRPDKKAGLGTSPSWSKDGKRLYYRGLGKKGQGDDVLWLSVNNFMPQTLLTFPGKPSYPPGLSVRPPEVDVRHGGQELFTMFYRLVEKDDKTAIIRWRVVFSQDGKVLQKKAEQLTK